MIELDPIEVPRMTDPAYEAEDKRQRALERLEAIAQTGTVYPPGQTPPPDPTTAARGAADVYGDDPFGGGPRQPLDAGTQGALQRAATPRPELLAAIRARQGMSPPNVPGRGEPPAPPSAEANPPPQDEGPRAKLGRLLAARQEPQERDYTGIDVADAIATPFRALARGLAYASGRAPGPTTRWGDQARARDRQADADAQRTAQAQAQMAGQAQDRALAERRVGAQERAQAALERRQDALTATGMQREDRMGRIGERALELRAQGMEASAALTQARLEAIQSTQAEREAMRDPNSPISAQARERLSRELGFLSEASGQTYNIPVEGLSASDVEAIERRLGVPRHVRQRASGSGGGAGGALGRPEWFGGSDQEWSALGATGRRSAILRHSQRSGEEEAGFPEVILGSGIRFGGDVDDVTIRDVRRGLTEARSHAAALGTIDRIARERGASATVDPRVEADLVAATQAMMAMVAEMRNTGVINPGEAPTIQAAIPNPTSLRQTTLGEVQRRVNSFRSLLEDRVRARLGVLGVSEDDQGRVARWLRSGSVGGGAAQGRAAPAGGPQPDRVRVRHPDGRTGSIPRAQLERARAAGFEEVTDGP